MKRASGRLAQNRLLKIVRRRRQQGGAHRGQEKVGGTIGVSRL